jgi:heme A synthase
MVRIIFTYIVPLLLPTAIYLAWAWYRTRYLAEHGGEPPQLEKGPWALLLFLGVVLTLASFAVTGLIGGSDAGALYTPSRLENGQVVPGRMDAKPR